MKKFGVLTLLLLCLAVWHGSAAASQWMYVERLEGTRMGSCTEYMDAESVVRNGSRLIYWTLWQLDEPGGNRQVKKVLWKKEVSLHDPKNERTLEFYQFDIDDIEVFRYLTPGMPTNVLDTSTALRASQYLREEGGSLSPKPASIDGSARLHFGLCAAVADSTRAAH